jgi:hypothetical protein
MKMDDKFAASRREVLAFASLAAAFVIGGDAAEAKPAAARKAHRPSKEDLARAHRLYGGELGGFKGAR